jgi:hypothetical protein
VIVGAPQEDPNGAESGVARVYLSGCPTPVVYCTAKVNSAGCVPAVSFEGAASLSVGNNFFVRAANVLNNKPGFLIWGRNTASIPLGGGTLCLTSSIVRTPAQNSGGNPPPNDCSGTYSFHFSQAYMISKGLAPGTSVYAQYYSRDGGFPPPDNIGLTDAVRFTVCP